MPVHYTGIYTGKVAVVAMLLPMRVSISCGNLYLSYLCIWRTACSISYWSAGSTGTVSRPIRNLREHLSSGADFV